MQPTRFHYQLAASVAALVVAAPVGMHMMRTHERAFERRVPAHPDDPAPLAKAAGNKAAGKTDASTAEAPAAPLAAATSRRVDRSIAPPDASVDSKPADQPAEFRAAMKSDSRGGEVDRRKAEGARDEDLARRKAAPIAQDHEQPAGNRIGALPTEAPSAPRKQAAPAPPAPPAAMDAAKPMRDGPIALAPPSPVPVAPGLGSVAPATSGRQFLATESGKISDGQAQQLGGVVSGEQRTATLMPPPRPEPAPTQLEEFRDQFQTTADNPVKQVAQEPVSTFSIDVDTASYSFARRALNAGRLPPKDAVRVEEMINYFPYDYTRPESADAPFQPNVSVFPAPWNSAHKLVHIGIKGYELKSAERPHANVVLLIDTSGSMGPQDRLPLLKNAFRMLVDELKPDDTVSIVTYAGDTRVALEPTKVSDKSRILAAIDGLRAGGGTYGEGGIKKAYELAEASFDAKGVNRIVLGTDGDFNIGISNRDELKGYIERKREKGIFLSIVGVGRGNYNDAMMQALAQNGNGTAAYVDTLSEARKVLVDEASSTLFTIARDVKIQVEFNPAVVSEYRLIGYETRMLKREDFNNDKVDAGDVGSGHTVTAIYEVTPARAAPSVDPLRYGAAPAAEPQRGVGVDTGGKIADTTGELGFLKLRYKLPKEATSRLLTLAVGAAQTKASVAEASTAARFSTAVAAFGQLLRGSPYLGSYGYDDVLALAQGARGDDRFGYRAEFLNLVRLAKSARN